VCNDFISKQLNNKIYARGKTTGNITQKNVEDDSLSHCTIYPLALSFAVDLSV